MVERSNVSRDSVHRGQAGEHVAELLIGVCRDRGIARIEKVPNALRVVRRGPGGLLCVPQKRTWCDYHGMLLDGTGRAVLVECKAATEDRLPLSRVAEHQWEALAEACRANAVAVLLVVRTDTPTVQAWAFPFESIVRLRAASPRGASAKLDPASPYFVDASLRAPFLARWWNR